METTTAFKITETTWPEKTFIIKKDRLSFDKLSQFFGPQYAAIYSGLQKLGKASNIPPYAFYYSIDMKNNLTELAAAVEINDPNIILPGFEKVTLPAGKVISTQHVGGYDTIMSSYEAMDKYLKEKGLQKELTIEQYLSDPAMEKDPSKWKTNIFFTIKK
jgi:effector-binding domain-containing protein